MWAGAGGLEARVGLCGDMKLPGWGPCATARGGGGGGRRDAGVSGVFIHPRPRGEAGAPSVSGAPETRGLRSRRLTAFCWASPRRGGLEATSAPTSLPLDLAAGIGGGHSRWKQQEASGPLLPLVGGDVQSNSACRCVRFARRRRTPAASRQTE